MSEVTKKMYSILDEEAYLSLYLRKQLHQTASVKKTINHCSQLIINGFKACLKSFKQALKPLILQLYDFIKMFLGVQSFME